MDVDKWDYLMRDSMYCGVKVSCDINRLRNFSKVSMRARLKVTADSGQCVVE